MTSPQRVDRPAMPEGYGPTDGLDGTLPWGWAEGRLVAATTYWVVTASPDGTPHAAPVWGVWQDDAVWFSTDPASTKGRNLAADGRVVVHLDSGDEVVVVHGRVDAVDPAAMSDDLRDRLDDDYAGKYGKTFRLTGGPAGSIVYRVAPDRVLAWTEASFPTDRTRWHLGGG